MFWSHLLPPLHFSIVNRYDYVKASDEGGSDTYDGLEVSLDYVEKEINRLQPYALCGFSQGGTIAALVSKRFRDQQANTHEDGDGEGKQTTSTTFETTNSVEKLLFFCTVPSMAFYAQFSGFVETPLEVPSLHCIGERDAWKERSVYFAENAFDKSTREVCVHSGNHKPPSIFEKKDGVFDVVATFLKK